MLASVGLFTAFGVINLLMPGNLGPSVIALIVGFIFSIFIVVDLQLVIGGRHYKYQLSVDEYCFAALNIYLDIGESHAALPPAALPLCFYVDSS